MRLYLHVSKETSDRGLFTPTLLELVDLWRRRFLPETATVWMNAEHDTGSFWALTDRSQFVQVISAGASPGFVRVTRDLARWARSFDDTTKVPLVSRDLKALPGGDKTKAVIIVKHTNSSMPVTVIDGGTGKSIKPDSTGVVEIDRVTVVDWPRFTGKEFDEPTQYERLNAELHGTEFMCDSVGPELAEFFRKHISDYGVNIEAQYLKQIGDNLHIIDNYSKYLATAMLTKVSEMQSNDVS